MEGNPGGPAKPTADGLRGRDKDEMNLAEFPITLLSERVPRGQKTIELEDEFHDEGTGRVIRRKLTIVGSDKYGLPTAKDDEVILGLVQLTKRANNFTERTVCFHRAELIKQLGWPETGQSYRRLDRSLDCWTFVGLSYENAWWDHRRKSWVTEKFHILERVTLYDREPRAGRGSPRPSSFTWSEAVFRSFQAGYLKRFDFDFYLGLRTATAKRMYRFLDKRFYHRLRWEFELEDFAFSHIGLSRSYEGATQLARKLRPAIEELEAKGFLEPLGPRERFLKGTPAGWKVVFVRKAGADAPAPSGGPSEQETALISRGVTPATAAALVAAHRSEHVAAKLEVFDWLVARKDRRISKSPAGYLVESIRGDYAAPQGFESQADRARRAEAERQRQRQEAEARRRERAEQARQATEAAQLREHWEALGPAEREQLDAEALRTASPELLASLAATRGTPLEVLARRLLREAHLRTVLGIPPAPEPGP